MAIVGRFDALGEGVMAVVVMRKGFGESEGSGKAGGGVEGRGLMCRYGDCAYTPVLRETRVSVLLCMSVYVCFGLLERGCIKMKGCRW